MKVNKEVGQDQHNSSVLAQARVINDAGGDVMWPSSGGTTSYERLELGESVNMKP